MESGQVHLDDRIHGVYCYYFLVDPESPTAPVPKRTRRFIIGCSVESYVEAFFGLVRHLNRDRLSFDGARDLLLPPPPSANVSTIGDLSNIHDRNPMNTEITTTVGSGGASNATNEVLRPWSHLYNSAFGPLAFDTFCRRVNSSESSFLFCERNEEEARIKAAQLANPTGASWGQTSTQAVSPTRPNPSITNRDAAHYAAEPALPGNISPYRNGNRLKGMNDNYFYSQQQQQQPQSAISGNAAHRLSQFVASSNNAGENNTISATARNEGISAAAMRVAGLNATNPHMNSSMTPMSMNKHLPSFLTASGGDIDAAKLKQELGDASNQLLLERSRAVVQNLSDAERAALIYKYESVRKELEEERKRTSNLRETLRVTMSDFEERLERLQQSSANALSEAAARERHNLDTIDKELTTKFKNERDQLELNLLERDRKLAKSLARVEFLEGQTDALQKRTDLLATEEQRAAAYVIKSKAEQERLEDECNRLRRSLAAVEARLDDETRTRRNTEVAYKSLENHSTSLKAENEKLRKDCERFAQYSVSLHDELRSLDMSANAAANFHSNNNNGGGAMMQQRQQQQFMQQQQRPAFPSGYGMTSNNNSNSRY